MAPKDSNSDSKMVAEPSERRTPPNAAVPDEPHARPVPEGDGGQPGLAAAAAAAGAPEGPRERAKSAGAAEDMREKGKYGEPLKRGNDREARQPDREVQRRIEIDDRTLQRKLQSIVERQDLDHDTIQTVMTRQDADHDALQRLQERVRLLEEHAKKSDGGIAKLEQGYIDLENGINGQKKDFDKILGEFQEFVKPPNIQQHVGPIVNQILDEKIQAALKLCNDRLEHAKAKIEDSYAELKRWSVKVNGYLGNLEQ